MGKRAEKARELFYQGYNCTQSVVGAFIDLFDMDFDTAMRFSDGMGGGMGRMRLTCGAVSAMAMIAGLKLSSGKPKDLKNRAEVYAKVREMSEDFRQKHGSIICRELLGAAMPKDNSPNPEERTAEYYKKRPCPDCIYDCAEIIEKRLFSEE
ncbi:MAG: C-GCAxxG-C-C family protein [Clostridium sp.]|nr:C-GCAxxG-C-C family protein [Clostridium sp.]MCM1547537.1 C-GCAxxG-C-C family protein [Ruminococcus sp.]